jgi:putative transposase
MKYDPSIHHRRSIRLQGYDYTQPGVYFFTICTQDRQCLFGRVVNGSVELSGDGVVAQECWEELPAHCHHVTLDTFVVMPNHVHGILVIADHVIDTISESQKEQFGKPIAGSIPTIIRLYKAAVTRRVNQRHGTPGARIWQRNYHEQIVRDDRSLHQIRNYIVYNPPRWGFSRSNS